MLLSLWLDPRDVGGGEHRRHIPWAGDSQLATLGEQSDPPAPWVARGARTENLGLFFIHGTVVTCVIVTSTVAVMLNKVTDVKPQRGSGTEGARGCSPS